MAIKKLALPQSHTDSDWSSAITQRKSSMTKAVRASHGDWLTASSPTTLFKARTQKIFLLDEGNRTSSMFVLTAKRFLPGPALIGICRLDNSGYPLYRRFFAF